MGGYEEGERRAPRGAEPSGRNDNERVPLTGKCTEHSWSVTLSYTKPGLVSAFQALILKFQMAPRKKKKKKPLRELQIQQPTTRSIKAAAHSWN